MHPAGLSRSLLLLLALLTLPMTVHALPSYEIVPLGLSDAEHTASDGYRASGTSHYTESGYVAGRSQRFGSGPSWHGESAWLYDATSGTTTRLGLFGAEYTRSDGFRYSRAGLVMESGYVTGTSERYGGTTFQGSAAWFYDASAGTTTRVGLFDADYTRSDGVQYSAANWLRASGYAAGRSVRYAGMETFGESAWFHDASDRSTTRLGYFDSDHVRSDGYQYSSITMLGESGYATGYSDRYGGTTYLGQTAWIHDPTSASTIRLGYFDSDHVRSDGYQYSSAGNPLASGRVLGSSSRYSGATWLGWTGWLYDAEAATTTRVGLLDSAHTRSDGYQDSRAGLLTESGYVAGFAERFAGATSLGRSVWLRDASGATARIGFFDAEHTRSDGYQLGSTNALAEAGYATGYSERFAGTMSLGRSAWLYDPASASNARVGLVEGLHTRSDGYQYATVLQLQESGYVLGYSERYNASSSYSQSAWLFDASQGATTRIGFFDAAHTASDGRQYSSVSALLTESGYVAGTSIRGAGGQSAWLYDSRRDITTRIGLFDSIHTASNGHQSTRVDAVTESGYAFGSSDRYSGTAPLGQTAWIYHAPTDSSESIVLSTRSDGSVYSAVTFLAEDGLALGSYRLYGTDGADLGLRAFAWTLEDGAVDLGGLVAGGLTTEGWSHLGGAIGALGLQHILGSGRLETGGDLAYLLVAVPEPGALLPLVGLLGILARRRYTSHVFS